MPERNDFGAAETLKSKNLRRQSVKKIPSPARLAMSARVSIGMDSCASQGKDYEWPKCTAERQRKQKIHQTMRTYPTNWQEQRIAHAHRTHQRGQLDHVHRHRSLNTHIRTATRTRPTSRPSKRDTKHPKWCSERRHDGIRPLPPRGALPIRLHRIRGRQALSQGFPVVYPPSLVLLPAERRHGHHGAQGAKSKYGVAGGTCERSGEDDHVCFTRQCPT